MTEKWGDLPMVRQWPCGRRSPLSSARWPQARAFPSQESRVMQDEKEQQEGAWKLVRLCWAGSLATRICHETSANQMGLYGSQSNIQLLNEEDLGSELTERDGLPWDGTAVLSPSPRPHTFCQASICRYQQRKEKGSIFFPWVAGSVFETLE